MNALLGKFLGEVEREEAALLSWGLVDGSLAEQELRDKAESFLGLSNTWNDFPDGYAIIEEMVARGLLFRWEDAGSYRYRSRMAEAVRLLARLRQLFPKHLRQPGGWIASPTLVADFRFLVRARRYPARDQQPAEWISHWVASDAQLTPLQEAVVRALLGAESEDVGFPLAGFQVRAMTRILNLGSSAAAKGTMISAGTGSGKTLAFYVPALALLTGMIERDAVHWTRVLALYPRNELLKDQFTETVRQARRIKAVLKRKGTRPIRTGAYFGATPNDSGEVVENSWGGPWPARSGGRICPFLTCPEIQCSGVMLWRDEDRMSDVERLVCEQCGEVVEADEIVLTRRRMTKAPPDILFTTTEMMNQRLTDASNWHLFGVGLAASRKPVLLLLDEAHTYGGAHGAQVAYLPRRWRHRSQATPHFVGLSATLMEAGSFFAQLIGLPPNSVEEISPEAGELIDEGVEYMLALRGEIRCRALASFPPRSRRLCCSAGC